MTAHSPLPRWIAHRGGGFFAPENTLEGIRLAARAGFRAVEFDVMLSADGTPWLLHDESLLRTTGYSARLDETPDAIVRRLRVAGGARLPSFSEALSCCRQHGLLAQVELKPPTGQAEALALAVVQAVAAENCRRQGPALFFSSFSAPALAVLQQVAPEWPRGLLVDVLDQTAWEAVRALGCASVHVHARRLSSADAGSLARLRGEGVALAAFTVSCPQQAHRLFKQGVATLFTDRLGGFIRWPGSPSRALRKSGTKKNPAAAG